MALTCNKSAELDFSATFTVPKEFEYVDGDNFSISISTDNLMVYKNIVEETIPSADVICDKTISDLKINIAQVNVAGYIYFRVAVDGLKSDELIIDPSIPNVTIEPAWSSADGIVSVKDIDGNNYMTIAYIPVDQEITDMPVKVYLEDIELGNISEDPQSDNKSVRIDGKFRLVYMP
jgi:hypothetical protein